MSRGWLTTLLLVDVITLISLLVEATTQPAAHTSAATIASCFCGFLTCAIGIIGCRWRLPLVIGVLAICSFIQLIVGLVVLHRTFPQLIHSILQLPIISGALTLRRTLLPLWSLASSSGRGRNPVTPGVM